MNFRLLIVKPPDSDRRNGGVPFLFNFQMYKKFKMFNLFTRFSMFKVTGTPGL
jgi:hypothetical protein